MTVKEKLKILMELQKIDDEILRLKQLKQRTPEDLKKLDIELERAEEEFNEEKNQHELLNEQRLRIERDIEEAKMLYENSKKRQFSVKTNEEYKALQKQIKETEEKISLLEDQLLEIYAKREKEDKEYSEKERMFDDMKKRILEEKKNIEKASNDSDEKILIKEDEKKRVAARLNDEPLFQRYERIRRSKGGKGVAVIEEAICTGCFSTIPPQKFAEIKRAERIFTCDMCGRILIYKYID